MHNNNKIKYSCSWESGIIMHPCIGWSEKFGMGIDFVLPISEIAH